MKRIALNYGHTLPGTKGSGAKGFICESTENREVGKLVKKYLEANGYEVIDATVDVSNSYLVEAVKKANAKAVDLSVSIHFNAGGGQGTEVLVYNTTGLANEKAKAICSEIASLGFKNRGVKKRTDLYWLKNTNSPALLVECCFVDTKSDVDKYKKETMAKAIAQGIMGKKIANTNNTTTNTNATTYYRVVAGSYTSKANAQKLVDELKAKGYSAFIDIYKK